MIYEYHCKQCDENFEVTQSMYDDAHRTHQAAVEIDCDGEIVRVYSGVQFNKKQGRSEVIPTDQRGSHITKHWDGRQDAHVVPESITLGNLQED